MWGPFDDFKNYLPSGDQMSPINGLPTWQTEGDLLQICPECKQQVAWPYTNDYTVPLYRAPLYKVSQEERAIVDKILGHPEHLFEVGARIPTLKTNSGVLWHEPCYMYAYWVGQQFRIKQVITILKRHFEL